MKINTKKFQKALRKQNCSCVNAPDFEFGLSKDSYTTDDIKWLFNGICNDIQMDLLIAFLTDEFMGIAIDKVIFPTENTIGVHVKGKGDAEYFKIKNK